MINTIIDLLFYVNIIIAYIAGAALIIWAIKASGLGAWMAKSWLGELTRPLWGIEKDNE